jgi:protein-L-isoaspartate(D-aspartate) O-methyltransferase
MTDRFWAERQRMVEQQIRRRGLDDARLLGAISDVPRHLFVPLATQLQAIRWLRLRADHFPAYIVAL